MSVLAASAPVWAAQPAGGVLHVLGDPVAFVLGFGLSGAVQSFVSHEQMERVMGDHRPAATAASITAT